MLKVRDVQALTVGELKEMLNNCDDDLPVVFSYPSGDYWHTVIVGEVTEVNEEVVEWSEYHEKFKLSDTADIPVLVLS